LFQNNQFDTTSPEVFLRPHDVDVDLYPTVSGAVATVSRIVHLGWEIEAELILEDGQPVRAVLSREKFDQLHLELQQKVYVKPKKARAFPQYATV
ncbi:TOBE domain-containing protein, partial [Chroococcidiopsis sp.]|uniref:TOBE domain-containing protein n=1 Tax=Chroococcidiopsis sp. TaxID=3088168 RepID=UPI003F362A80